MRGWNPSARSSPSRSGPSCAPKAAAQRLSDLRGRRVAVGPEGSGTRVLALAMLAANDIGPGEIEALPLTGAAAAEALASGAADGAILVSARTTGAIATLLRAGPAVRLVDFAERADAYAVHLPFLSAVRLPRGGLSLAADLPDRALTLLAPVASVVAHEDIHPQVVSLLVGIMQEVHRPRTLFAAEGAFPNTLAQDLPMNADAERYYARGRTALQRWLPFWVAVWVERLLFILLPVLGLARAADPLRPGALCLADGDAGLAPLRDAAPDRGGGGAGDRRPPRAPRCASGSRRWKGAWRGSRCR